MPGLDAGIYIGQLPKGTQVSSTYEGRHITVREDELIHPFDDGFVNKGDPCILCKTATPGTYGSAVGVAFNDGPTTPTMVALDTEGIWNLEVSAYNDSGGVAVEIGDLLYIRAGGLLGTTSVLGTGDAELSKRNDIATQIPFGYALGRMESGDHGRIAVKVHFDPPELNGGEKIFSTVGTDEYGWAFRGIITDSHSDSGIAGMFEAVVEGAADGPLYGLKSWLYLMGGATSLANAIVTPFETGLYTVDNDTDLRGYFAGQHQAILNGPPAFLYAWRLNSTQPVTAVIAAANQETVGFEIDAVDNAGANKLGNVPLFDIVGHGICYVEVFSA